MDIQSFHFTKNEYFLIFSAKQSKKGRGVLPLPFPVCAAQAFSPIRTSTDFINCGFATATHALSSLRMQLPMACAR